jgi:RNA polymerase sigma-B factor
MTQSVFEPYSPMPLRAQGPTLNSERKELVLAHLGLADALARRYRSSRFDWCDLQQVARLGLLKAATRFRIGGESNFVAYAVPTICGELKRHLRDHGWVVRAPRRVQELRHQLHRTAPALEQQLCRKPTRTELAGALAVGTRDIDEALLSESGLYPESLDASGPTDSCSALSECLGCEDESFARIDEVVSLNCALHDLTAWERRLLSLRFRHELKQQDIADILGISQMQVSRALTALLAKLRGQLNAC